MLWAEFEHFKKSETFVDNRVENRFGVCAKLPETVQFQKLWEFRFEMRDGECFGDNRSLPQHFLPANWPHIKDSRGYQMWGDYSLDLGCPQLHRQGSWGDIFCSQLYAKRTKYGATIRQSNWQS